MADNEKSQELAESINGDWVASTGISYEGETVALEIYRIENNKIRFIDKDNQPLMLEDNGVYICLRLADTAEIGDTIEISPYGSEETYRVTVAGYLRSVISESIVMTDKYAVSAGIPYHISSIYTDEQSDKIQSSDLIAGKQEKKTIMDTYDSFMDIMNTKIGRAHV